MRPPPRLTIQDLKRTRLYQLVLELHILLIEVLKHLQMFEEGLDQLCYEFKIYKHIRLWFILNFTSILLRMVQTMSSSYFKLKLTKIYIIKIYIIKYLLTDQYVRIYSFIRLKFRWRILQEDWHQYSNTYLFTSGLPETLLLYLKRQIPKASR